MTIRPPGNPVVEVRELEVPVYRGNHKVMCALRWKRHADFCTFDIELDGPDEPVHRSGRDLFDALQQVRLELERQGLVIAVQGARTDAYPTGMIRNMVAASRVYIMEIGRDVERKHLVNTFAEAELHTIGTVEQQDAHYREWLEHRNSAGQA
ncbi:hypothetical protein OHA21_10470 [Actinoplanes sp. NBC_00393]|uniref:hypothetical protein n=1 Tax=Actinoplanes sp. NBC_00393 TaxID=2975953 RepID=UPI002E1BBE64